MCHGQGGAGSLVAVLGEQRGDECVEARVDRGHQRRQARRCHVQVLPGEVGGRGAGEQRATGQHFPQNHAERVQVRARVDGEPAKLLRRHVLRRADAHGPDGDRCLPGVDVEQLRDPEVEDLHRRAARALRQEQVLGLQIAVDHSGAVGGRDAGQDLPQDVDGFAGRNRAAVDAASQRLAVQQLHQQHGPSVRRRGEAEDIDQVRVADLVHQPRLLNEALDGVGSTRDVGVNHLGRGALADQRVNHGVDGAHAAGTEQPLDPVAAHHRAGREIAVHRRPPGALQCGGSAPSPDSPRASSST